MSIYTACVLLVSSALLVTAEGNMGKWASTRAERARLDKVKRKATLRRVERFSKDVRCGINVASLNVNGLTENSKEDVKAAIRSRALDVIGLSETKWRREGREEFKLAGFDVHEARRSDIENDEGKKIRKGGGLMVLTRKGGMGFKRLCLSIKDKAKSFVECERIWVEYSTVRGSTALCFPYFGFQAVDDRHGLWNDTMYEVLEDEITDLRAKGYRVCIMGDFNARVGNVLSEGGIPGNCARLTLNGRRFLEFLNRNQLTHLNGATRFERDWSTRISTGLWSRHGVGNIPSSVLDYGVISSEHLSSVIQFEVDSEGLMGGASDHSFLFAQLREAQGKKMLLGYGNFP